MRGRWIARRLPRLDTQSHLGRHLDSYPSGPHFRRVSKRNTSVYAFSGYSQVDISIIRGWEFRTHSIRHRFPRGLQFALTASRRDIRIPQESKERQMHPYVSSPLPFLIFLGLTSCRAQPSGAKSTDCRIILTRQGITP